jgi:hypothetical protein
MASAVAAAVDTAIQLDDEQLAHASDRNSTFLRPLRLFTLDRAAFTPKKAPHRTITW